MIGDGTKNSPYKSFEQSEFERKIRNLGTREVFFRGNYHTSIIFDELRSGYKRNQFGGIIFPHAIATYIESQDDSPNFNYQTDFPFDLGEYINSNACIEPSYDTKFIDYLRRQSLFQLMLLQAEDSIIKIFHRPLLEKNSNNKSLLRILKLRKKEILGISRDQEGEFIVTSR